MQSEMNIVESKQRWQPEQFSFQYQRRRLVSILGFSPYFTAAAMHALWTCSARAETQTIDLESAFKYHGEPWQGMGPYHTWIRAPYSHPTEADNKGEAWVKDYIVWQDNPVIVEGPVEAGKLDFKRLTGAFGSFVNPFKFSPRETAYYLALVRLSNKPGENSPLKGGIILANEFTNSWNSIQARVIYLDGQIKFIYGQGSNLQNQPLPDNPLRLADGSLQFLAGIGITRGGIEATSISQNGDLLRHISLPKIIYRQFYPREEGIVAAVIAGSGTIAEVSRFVVLRPIGAKDLEIPTLDPRNATA